MPKSKKVLFSILLILISFSCFIFMPPSRSRTLTSTVTVSPDEKHTETIATQSPGISKLLEWIGIGAIILAAWLWRKELGVTQLGPLGGADPVSQQPAGAPPKPQEESGTTPSLDLATISKEMADATTQQQLKHIMQMFQKTHSVNVSHVARELGVTTITAKTYLFLLTKTGQLRADGFPKHTIYTPSKSLENRVLNAARQKLSETYYVLSERRYVRIKRMYEIDALFESEEMTFIVEAKILRNQDLVSRLDNWVLQLLKVAKEFRAERIACVFAISCLGDANVDDVKKQVAALTFDSGSVPVKILVFSESELTE